MPPLLEVPGPGRASGVPEDDCGAIASDDARVEKRRVLLAAETAWVQALTLQRRSNPAEVESLEHRIDSCDDNSLRP